MNTLRMLPLLTSLALSLPLAAHANSFVHDAGGDGGITLYPDHEVSKRSRAEVGAEVDAARKNGSLGLLQRGLLLPIKVNGPVKTRDQVQQEYLGMSASEKQRLQEMYGAGR